MRNEKTELCYCQNCNCETTHDVIQEYYCELDWHEETWTCRSCGEEN